MSAQPVVYRVYDADDRLLYIGCTGNFRSRWVTHRSTSWWTALAKRISVEVHLHIDDARRTEKAAIHRERPAFNHTFNERRLGERPPLTQRDRAAVRAWLDESDGHYLPLHMRGLGIATA